MATIYVCSNPALWHPTLHTKQDHHFPPLAWRKAILEANPNADQSWWRIITLCGLCHDEYHKLSNLYIHCGGTPPWNELSTYSIYLRKLMKEAWGHRVRPKMPWTVANPVAA